MTILIIDNYDSFTFNLFQMMQAQTDQKVIVKRNDAITPAEIIDLDPCGIVLSPGPGHPANKTDFGVCGDIITNAQKLAKPILGVCLGHQGIGHYFGATVCRAPEIMHGKMSNITLTADSRLFHGMSKSFSAMRYHSLVVQDGTLPSCLKVTARDERSNLIMAMEHQSLPIYGVQFHPESIGTPEGKSILRNFIALC
jgi:anthranilate synthase component II